uniref:Uncharacterized protein n=1 Tax=Siphoviridae sp. ctOXk3 TaxID=2827861 RepID=A0A8S5SYN4_9CAUD|nr:MAG TPA: hypothetical protein [Siphoviridae sp. ctOXk3]
MYFIKIKNELLSLWCVTHRGLLFINHKKYKYEKQDA